MYRILPFADYSDPALALYKDFSEVQLLHYREPDPGIFIAESPHVIQRALQAGYHPLSFLVEESQLSQTPEELFAFHPEAPIYLLPKEQFQKLTGFPMTRGVLCAMERRPLPTMEELCKEASRIAILENVVNPTNVGAIFRSAAALGVDAILLTAGCSDPLYRRAARVSMGTVFQVPWTYLDKKKENWPIGTLSKLHTMGFITAAMALEDRSVSLGDPCLSHCEKLAVLLGSEGDGLLPETISHCDYTVKIPMSHEVDSLNVAAASAVTFWELRKR